MRTVVASIDATKTATRKCAAYRGYPRTYITGCCSSVWPYSYMVVSAG
jgi:hypothetical protein